MKATADGVSFVGGLTRIKSGAEVEVKPELSVALAVTW